MHNLLPNFFQCFTYMVILCFAAALPACSQAKVESNPPPAMSAANSNHGTTAANSGQHDDMYWGDDAFAQSSPYEGGKSRGSAGQSSKKPAKPSPKAPESNQDDPPASRSTWSLVLGTFTEPGHEDAARQMIIDLPRIAPQAAGARVHTTFKGSMVVYGNYTGRDDPNAKADLERLKAINVNGTPVFNRIILTKLDLRLAQGQLHPFDLLAARKAHPKVDPMYTLDVAIWMSNNDHKAGDRVTYEEVKRKAEAFAAQLRAKNEEAYFYHDDDNQWSTVTVSLFDRRAIDQRSGLFSDEVTTLMRRFPARLVNGEPLIELKDPRDPKKGGTPQAPKLVLVPMM